MIAVDKNPLWNCVGTVILNGSIGADRSDYLYAGPKLAQAR